MTVQWNELFKNKNYKVSKTADTDTGVRKGPTPERLAANGSEDSHQIALFCQAQLFVSKYPELKWLYHTPNGGSRHIAEAGKLKAMGVKAGFPDIGLLVPRRGYHGLFIELKIVKGITTQNQLDWQAELRQNGFCAEIRYGWQSAWECIVWYLDGGF